MRVLTVFGVLALSCWGEAAIDLGGYVQKMEAAAKEAWSYGYKDFLAWGVEPGKGADYLNKTLVFSHADVLDAAPGSLLRNVSCFRIPSIVQTASGVLVAFAEARGSFPRGSCADCSPLGIATKRSLDGGMSWTQVQWAVLPTFGAPGSPVTSRSLPNSGGNPVAVVDGGKILLHFVRGSSPNGDCIPGHSNWEVESMDDGVSWSQPRDISKYLATGTASYVGALPGPGSGAVRTDTGRLVFCAHYSTAERPDAAVVVYFSDDGGGTYQLSESVHPAKDECTITSTGMGEELVLNMRQDNGCFCRAVSRSSDGGQTWSPAVNDTHLVDSVCEASVSHIQDPSRNSSVNVFFNPAMQHARSMPTLRFSRDGGVTWPQSTLLGDRFADYSALLPAMLIRGREGPRSGVIWGSCSHPLPYRVWCLPVESLDQSFWNIYFTEFAIP